MMRRRIFSLLIASVVLVLAFSESVLALSASQKKALQSGVLYANTEDLTCSATQTTNGSVTNNLYFIGDSLTVGMNNTTLGQESLSEQLKAKGWIPTINAQGCRPLYNANPGQEDGFQGNGTACPLGTITSAFNEFEKDKEAIRTAGVVVIALGTNNYEGSEDVFKQKAKEYIAKVRELNTSIGSNIYWVNTYTKGGGKAERAASIGQVVSETGIKLIDFRSVATNETTYSYPTNDSTHHDTNGYVNKTKFVVDALGEPVVIAPSTTSGGYNPIALSYPNFPDEAAIAAGIEATIARRRANSPWLDITNLGQKMIDEGKQYNVNPLLVVASGSTESGFGTSSVGQNNKNSFGRTSSGTGYITFDSFETDLFGDGDTASQRGFFKTIANNLYGDGAGGRYKEAKDIYEYFSIHQTGQIHYPGDGMYLADNHTTPPTIVSWDSPYNPMQYYRLNIEIINEVTGLNLPSDNPPGDNSIVLQAGTCFTNGQNGGPLVPGAGGYDLPNEGTNPMVYYSQLTRGSDTSVEGYFGASPYGTRGTIEECGCGPTSYAMAVATMTSRKIKPDEMAKWAADNGGQMESCGSLWFWENQTAVSEFGLAATRVNGTDQIMQSLMDGKLVIASVTNFPLPNNPAGHITLLRKYVDGQFYFADPFSTGWAAVDDVSRRPYSAEEVASMINVAWALSPAR